MPLTRQQQQQAHSAPPSSTGPGLRTNMARTPSSFTIEMPPSDSESAHLLSPPSSPPGPTAPSPADIAVGVGGGSPIAHSHEGSSPITTPGKKCPLGSGRVQKLVLVALALAVLSYQFFSDHVYIWMMTTEVTSMLVPGATRYCTHESLWVPFHSDPVHRSVAIVSVADKRPDMNTPTFKRLASKLQLESLRQQVAYADFWGYDHVMWEGEEHREELGKRPVAWGKLLALREALEAHEYALYLDLDLAIVNPMLQLDGFIDMLERSGRDVLVSQDANGVNTGVMLFKRSDWTKWLLSELWRLSDTLGHCDCIFYYEQRAFHHAMQTDQWRAGYKWWTRLIPIVGWFPNMLRGHPPGPTLEQLPMRTPNGTAVTAEDIRSHVELVPQCAFNAVDSYTDAEFIVHFAGQKGRRKERLMGHFGAIAADRLDKVARPLRFLGTTRLPVVHQTWKSHELDPVKNAWHMSWRRNGFVVSLRNDTECLADVERLAAQTGNDRLVPAYQSLTPVQRADFWRYVITYLEGGIYSDIDIAATPDTTKFFMERWDPSRTDLVGIIENGPYDNSIGRFHWKVGMSPMYSRIPQLRQSFFYARRGHPRLLELIGEITRMADLWVSSKHTDIGKPAFDAEALRKMAETGSLTLEMTGPGVWTDYMLAPLRRDRGARGLVDNTAAGGNSIVLNTLEGYSLIRYGSMGSWKTQEHKGDQVMWRNVLAFYSVPLILALLCRLYTKRGKRVVSKIA